MKAGAAWEAQLSRLHDRYRQERLAVILRCHPGVRVLASRGPTFTAAWEAQGPPDFLGQLYSGRGVAFDAKDYTGRFPLGGVARHQARDLEAYHAAGGVAGVALRLDGDGYWLPWAELGPRWWAWHESTAKAASITPDAWWRPFDVFGAGWLACL